MCLRATAVPPYAHPAPMRHTRAASVLQLVLTGHLPQPCAGCLTDRQLCRCREALDVWRAGPGSRALPRNFPVLATAHYSGQARRLLVSWKERGDPWPAAVLAAALAPVVMALVERCDEPANLRSLALVPIPSRPRATVDRGGNIVRALAADTAALLRRQGTPCRVASAGLKRAQGLDQVGLSAVQRRSNAMSAYRLARGFRSLGPVILVDDVATTGATLGACRSLLTESGHTVIGAAVLCATRVFPWP